MVINCNILVDFSNQNECFVEKNAFLSHSTALECYPTTLLVAHKPNWMLKNEHGGPDFCPCVTLIDLLTREIGARASCLIFHKLPPSENANAMSECLASL